MSCSCMNCRTPGFRFHPTDEQLMDQLINKILGLKTPGRQIAVVDELGKMEPWEIPELTTNRWGDDQICYFFWRLVYKKNGISRTAKNGYWKATGKDRKVKAKTTKKIIGLKKTLVFYESRSPPARTPWVIHEYHLVEPGLSENKEKYVLCKLKLKDGKTEFSSPEEALSAIDLPLVLGGNNEEDQLTHSPANSTTCNANGEESLSIHMPSSFKNDCFSSGEKEEIHNASSGNQISVFAGSAQMASLGHHHPEFGSQDYELRSDLPYNVGSYIARDALPDDTVDPAKLGSAEGCTESFLHASSQQLLKHGEAMVTCEQAPVSCSFSFDNGGQIQSSTDEIDEHEWKSLLVDSIELYAGEGNEQQNVVSGIEGLDTVSTSTQSSSRKRLREEGSGFSDGEPETPRAKVELQGQNNVTSTIEESEQDLKWAILSQGRRQELISYRSCEDEDMQKEVGGLSLEDLFSSDDFGLHFGPTEVKCDIFSW